MQTFKTLADVVALAEFAHRNQTDKAGLPYIEHPRRVMKAVQAQGAMPYVQMAAILHDVTEDTAFTCDMLLDLGVPEAAVNIVRLVDRANSEIKFNDVLEMQRMTLDSWASLDENELNWAKESLGRPWWSADQKDDFYYYSISKNPGAVQVKLADIGDNLQPWRLAYLPEVTQTRLREKYAKAIEMLS